ELVVAEDKIIDWLLVRKEKGVGGFVYPDQRSATIGMNINALDKYLDTKTLVNASVEADKEVMLLEDGAFDSPAMYLPGNEELYKFLISNFVKRLDEVNTLAQV